MLRFKTNRIQNEWDNKALDKRLRAIVFYVVGIINNDTYDRYVKITDIFRSKAEQEKIYGTGTKKVSVHQDWRGIDFIVEFEDEENESDIFHELLAESINNTFEHDAEGKYQTALFHNVGAGWHIHIQVSYADQTKVKK